MRASPTTVLGLGSLFLMALLATACSGDKPSAPASPSETPPPLVLALTPLPSSTPTQAPAPTATRVRPTPVPTPVVPEITGLDTVLGLTPPTRVVHIPAPGPGASLQGPPGVDLYENTVLYDFVRGQALDLGPGVSPGEFSRDGKYMVWSSPRAAYLRSDAWIIDLVTLEKRSLGPGYGASFHNDTTVQIRGHLDPNTYDRTLTPLFFYIDVTTGLRRPFQDRGVEYPQTSSRLPRLAGAELTGSPVDRIYWLEDSPRPRTRMLQFKAATAKVLDSDTIVAVSEMVVTEPHPQGHHQGEASVYLISVSAQTAKYVATIPGGNCRIFDANQDYILWSDHHFPNNGGASIMLYDRKTESITRLGGINEFARFTKDGYIGLGFRLIEDLIDPRTMRYVHSLPDGASWSEDRNYASTGRLPGQGGC